MGNGEGEPGRRAAADFGRSRIEAEGSRPQERREGSVLERVLEVQGRHHRRDRRQLDERPNALNVQPESQCVKNRA